MRSTFAFEATDTGSRLTMTSRFDALEQLEQLLALQMLEGTKEAMSQIDSILADLAAFATDRATEAQILSDTQVRVARVIRGSVAQVWRAHNDCRGQRPLRLQNRLMRTGSSAWQQNGNIRLQIHVS